MPTSEPLPSLTHAQEMLLENASRAAGSIRCWWVVPPEQNRDALVLRQLGLVEWRSNGAELVIRRKRR